MQPYRPEAATRRCLLRSAIAVALLMAPVFAAAAQKADSAIAAARRGGVVLYCRHAITDQSREDDDRVDYANVRTQRVLSREGERQAQDMGNAFRALGIPLRDVVASPMQRARRTAELMAGRARIDSLWHTNDNNYEGPRRDARVRVVTTRVDSGTTLIVSHLVTMASAVPESRGELEEGDCMVLRPHGDRYTVIGIVEWRDWLAAAKAARRE